MEEEIKRTVEVLRKGGVIIYPTDTVWGIGCDATNDKAVKKIFKIKKRMEQKSMIVLICKPENIKTYVKNVPSIAFDLMKSWNKPLTIVYDGIKKLAKSLVSDDNTIAVRVSQNEFNKRIIEELGKPIVSTSANFSGKPTPVFFNEIDIELLKKVDHVVNLQRNRGTDVSPSTIIRIFPDGNFEVLRN